MVRCRVARTLKDLSLWLRGNDLFQSDCLVVDHSHFLIVYDAIYNQLFITEMLDFVVKEYSAAVSVHCDESAQHRFGFAIYCKLFLTLC